MTLKRVSPEPSGWLEHEPTHTCFAVYGHLGWWRKWWLRMTVGLKYISK